MLIYNKILLGFAKNYLVIEQMYGNDTDNITH